MKNILAAVAKALSSDSKQHPIRHELIMFCLFMAGFLASFTGGLVIAALFLWLDNQII